LESLGPTISIGNLDLQIQQINVNVVTLLARSRIGTGSPSASITFELTSFSHFVTESNVAGLETSNTIIAAILKYEEKHFSVTSAII
jgi:hypothetical protein